MRSLKSITLTAILGGVAVTLAACGSSNESASAGVAGIAAAVAAPVLGGPVQPVAYELFTSQGCSSCPPADKLAEKYANDANVVVITRPVTYWDGLGWKDTLAREDNTDLQRAYARRGMAGSGVYTPQTVIQGGDATVGSRMDEVARLISTAQHKPGPDVTIVRAADGGRTVTLSGNAQGTLKVVALRSSVDVAIGNGENSGRKVRYVNVVVGETPVGNWSGGNGNFTVPASALRIAGADRYALVVQNGSAGPIVAARYL